ncbi:hypothetical protein DFH27DRAFT_611147 [Peziza echinospora]|nr:hypothetical protein DFH27DRAFT_611147 [Peziza echinospora]
MSEILQSLEDKLHYPDRYFRGELPYQLAQSKRSTPSATTTSHPSTSTSRPHTSHHHSSHHHKHHAATSHAGIRPAGTGSTTSTGGFHPSAASLRLNSLTSTTTSPPATETILVPQYNTATSGPFTTSATSTSKPTASTLSKREHITQHTSTSPSTSSATGAEAHPSVNILSSSKTTYIQTTTSTGGSSTSTTTSGPTEARVIDEIDSSHSSPALSGAPSVLPQEQQQQQQQPSKSKSSSTAVSSTTSTAPGTPAPGIRAPHPSLSAPSGARTPPVFERSPALGHIIEPSVLTRSDSDDDLGGVGGGGGGGGGIAGFSGEKGRETNHAVSPYEGTGNANRSTEDMKRSNDTSHAGEYTYCGSGSGGSGSGLPSGNKAVDQDSYGDVLRGAWTNVGGKHGAGEVLGDVIGAGGGGGTAPGKGAGIGGPSAPARTGRLSVGEIVREELGGDGESESGRSEGGEDLSSKLGGSSGAGHGGRTVMRGGLGHQGEDGTLGSRASGHGGTLGSRASGDGEEDEGRERTL